MAGIGIQLRYLLRKDTFVNIGAAYGSAAMISAGPWVMSIVGILLLGILLQFNAAYKVPVSQFQVSVTYLIATSLIFSSFAQHSFTRYISDTLFLKQYAKIIPNLNGILLLSTVTSGILSLTVTAFFFPEQSIFYRIMLIGSFVTLCNIWILTNLLSGLKDYRTVLSGFFCGYIFIIGIAYILRDFGVNGFLFGFLLGNLLIFYITNITIYKEYSSPRLIDFEFLDKKKIYFTLVFTSFLFNLAIWVDKFIFWFNPLTSEVVIGPLRTSPLYDVPIFLAYLAILPGMAVFLLRVETDFSDYYMRFNNAIRGGGSLHQIRVMREQMVTCAKYSIYEILKIQSLVIIGIFLFGSNLLNLLEIPAIYRQLLNIDVIGTSLQVVFLGILNVSFYLDKRKEAMLLSLLLVILNLVFTLISIHLGPSYYGYGFTLAFLISCMLGYYWLTRTLEDLEYKMIMLR